MGVVTIRNIDGRGTGDFREFRDAVAELHTRQGALVDSLAGQAMAYVWGWQDAGNGDRDSALAWQFHIAYGWHAYLYAAEKIGFRRPIQDAWKLWRDGTNLNVSEYR